MNEKSAGSETSGASEKLLASMAILQVNWQQHGRGYLDNFVPFAIEAMRRSGTGSYSASEISDSITKEFGFDIPENVVRSIVRSAVRSGFGKRERDGRFTPAEHKLRNFDDSLGRQTDLLRQQRNLGEMLAQFADERFGLVFTPEQAGDELSKFVDTYSATILGASQAAGAINAPDYGLSRPEETAIAAFIDLLLRSHPTEFEYLINVVKGAMLASSLFRDDDAPVDDVFVDTTLYLDTGVLFRYLGYFGSAAQSAELATINGAIRFGAHVACFEETLAETRGVMLATADQMSRIGFSPDTKSIGFHFVEQGYTAEEVRSAATSLEREFAVAGIEIRSRPSHAEHLTVGEDDLAKLLDQGGGYFSKAALNHDIDALTAVYRIRKKRAGDRIERSRATFITTNPRVVRAARQLNDFGRELTPLAIFEDRLATRIWVKTPLAYPDLPRDLLVARVASLLHPTRRVWAKYLEQIERLKSRGKLTQDDEILLRQHYEAARALVEESHNETKSVSEDTVRVVLDRIVSSIKQPVESERDALKADWSIQAQVLADERAARQKSETFKAQLERRCRGAAQVSAQILRWAVSAVLVALLVLSFVFDWNWLSRVAQAAGLLALIFGSIIDPLKKMGEWVEKRIFALLSRVLGLGPRP